MHAPDHRHALLKSAKACAEAVDRRRVTNSIAEHRQAAIRIISPVSGFTISVTLSLVLTARTCLVSFTDSEDIRHSVEVSAGTLYEAAALAISEFRLCGFTTDAPGPATRLTVAVQAPATSHEVRISKIEAWLQGAGKSPSEQALKVRRGRCSRGR